METTVVVIGIILLLIVVPLFFFFRRKSTDIRLEGDLLVLRYPFAKEEISLSDELKSWQLQQANFLWWGRVYSVNIELKSGKWKQVNSRFNRGGFEAVFDYLKTNYADKRKANNK
jgi:hypothetical protein